MALNKQLQSDASEFGRAIKCRDWRLGLLVARNVALVGQGARTDLRTSAEVGKKVSAAEFAKLASDSECTVSERTVQYYYKAWELAADAGLVVHADQIEPGDDEVDHFKDSIEDKENPKTKWSYFYQLAKEPAKPEPKPEPERPKSNEDEAESGSVDSDFGTEMKNEQKTTKKTAEEKAKEAAEADAENQKLDLLDILDTVRAMTSRIEKASAPKNSDNDELVGKVVGAAMELQMAATDKKLKTDQEQEKEKENQG